jgi:hypothetical protein
LTQGKKEALRLFLEKINPEAQNHIQFFQEETPALASAH